MADPYSPHRLDEVMREVGCSNRGLATLIEPTDEKRRNATRLQIITWRNGQRMTPESADRVAAGLRKAGWEGTAEDLLISGPDREAEIQEDLAQLSRGLEDVHATREFLARLEPVLIRL